MKKIIALAVSAVLLFASGVSVSAMADSADCACVINGATGEVIFSKNINKKHAMASTTKIMTAVIALERCPLDDVVTVSANAANQEGSSAYVAENMQLYMRDMLYGLMLNSGNDAAVAIAEHVAGSVEAFAELMNEKTLELGLRNTHFVNPNGLDDPEHYTTAADLALIARYAMANADFREIVGTLTYQAQPLNAPEILYFANHNKMFELYAGATGIKTGYTQATGRCLVSSAKRDDMEFIAVTLGDGDDWNDHMQMLDYAFSEHYPKKVIEAGMKVKVAEIDGKRYNMVAAGDFTVPLREKDRVTVDVVSHIVNDLQSPINAGEKVGYLEVCSGGTVIGSVDIVSESEIRDVSNIRLKNSFYSSFIHIVKRLLV